LKLILNKGQLREKHDTTAACQQGKVEEVYFKSKCGHSILLDIHSKLWDISF
jgi:hypothetical protein